MIEIQHHHAHPLLKRLCRLEATIAEALDARGWRHTLTRHEHGVAVTINAPHGTWGAFAPRCWLAAGAALAKAIQELEP